MPNLLYSFQICLKQSTSGNFPWTSSRIRRPVELKILTVQASKPIEQQLRLRMKSYINPKSFPMEFFERAEWNEKINLKSYAIRTFPGFCELKDWRCLSWEKYKWFWIRPNFCEKERISTLEKRDKNCLPSTLHDIPCIPMYTLHSTVHAVSPNVNFKRITSIFHTCPIYCPTFDLIFTWGHFIQVTIPVSVSYEVTYR